MTRYSVSAPHKLLLSGAYTVLDGHPALGLAVEPRMHLTLDTASNEPWPRDNPFAEAVRSVMREEAHRLGVLELPHSLGFSTHTEMPVHGWGVGSSAAFVTCLTHACSLAMGLSLDPTAIFALARRAHRLAQQEQGSGLDIAACTFGGLIGANNAHTASNPHIHLLEWPEEIGVLLIRSDKKADTREMIQTYRQTPKEQARAERDALLRSIDRVWDAAFKKADILAALDENNRCEADWSRAMQIPLVTPLQLQLEQAFAAHKPHIVIKSLGAGGGDSIGCFYHREQLHLADIAEDTKAFALQVRPVRVERHGSSTHTTHSDPRTLAPSTNSNLSDNRASHTQDSSMATDLLAPYQEHAQRAWEALQPQLLQQERALAPMLAHHFQATGKLLRPAIALAFFDQLNARQTFETPHCSEQMTQTALAIELLHNATLIHDDLQDGDAFRRGIPTVWKAFDAYQAINAGSALYFYALQGIANLSLAPLTIVRLHQLFAAQTLAIIAGQALEKQLWAALDDPQPHQTETLYLEVVEKKTSALFALPMMSAAILADLDPASTLALQDVARPLGALFQIQDDILDLFGNKGRDTVGTDIAEGKPSYPALYALQHASADHAARLYQILRSPREQTTHTDILWAIDLIRSCGALHASLQKMHSLRQQALEALVHAVPAPHTPTSFLHAVCDKIMHPIQHLSHHPTR